MTNNFKLAVGRNYANLNSVIHRMVYSFSCGHDTLFVSHYGAVFTSTGRTCITLLSSDLTTALVVTDKNPSLSLSVGQDYLTNRLNLVRIECVIGSGEDSVYMASNGNSYDFRGMVFDSNNSEDIVFPYWGSLSKYLLYMRESQSTNIGESENDKDNKVLSFQTLVKTFDFYKKIEDLKNIASILGVDIEIRVRNGEDCIDVS